MIIKHEENITISNRIHRETGTSPMFRSYTLLANPESGLHLQSDAYILADLLHELEA